MSSISRCWGLVGWGAALAAGVQVAACGDGKAGDLFSQDAGLFELPARGGRSGLGGRAGRAGSGGTGGAAGRANGGAGGNGGGETDAGNDGGSVVAEAGPNCEPNPTCDDDNDCTADACNEGVCEHSPLEAGEACGSGRDDECTSADTCNGDGACQRNDGQDGAACPGGSCTLGECIEGQAVGCPIEVVSALPFNTNWRSVGGTDLYDGTCDGSGTPDYAVVFTAPATGTYRFEATGVVGMGDPENAADDDASELADSVLTIAAGSCAGPSSQQLGCNDDCSANDCANDSFDSRLDLALSQGQSVTVYVNEFHEVLPGGGSGTLGIRLLPD
jgi:hypothetical protein